MDSPTNSANGTGPAGRAHRRLLFRRRTWGAVAAAAVLGIGIAAPGTSFASATSPDPSWAPMITTPPYPEYPSGYNAFNSTVVHGLAALFQTRQLQLTLISTAVPGAQRHYDRAGPLLQDVVDARVWEGIHFRTADTAAKQVGKQLAAWTLDRYFQPVHDGDWPSR